MFLTFFRNISSIWYRMRKLNEKLLIFLFGKTHCVEAADKFIEKAFCITKLFSKQWKLHTAQKVHRSLQLYLCYSRMWGEEMTCKMIQKLQRSLLIGGRVFLWSTVCIIPYDWTKNRLTDEKLKNCVEEYETVQDLYYATVCCEKCLKRLVINKKMPNIEYCTCNGCVGYVDKSRQFDQWEAFLERENILVWRRKNKEHPHLYSYKVYGTYNDVSLSAFSETQLNPSFRTQWDTTALELKIINSDPQSNSDLMYWLVKFPPLFANRDYIFRRRFRVNEQRKEVVIVNEIDNDSQFPESKSIHRVKEYWSTMVLRAKENFNKPGMSYTLTYFDNPGTSLPATVTDFVASTAFPDFLTKVYKAAKSLQECWENGDDVYVSLPPELRYPRKIEEELDLVPRDSTRELIPSSEVFSKLTRLKITKEAMKDSTVGDPSDNNKIRKSVINLLEALDVVSPEYEKKTALTAKVEVLIDKLGLYKSNENQLVRKLEALRNKTNRFISDASKKKEESLKIMKEFERRKYYYEQANPDEPTLIIITSFLQAINDVLKTENDLRTGKGFAKETENRPLNDDPPFRNNEKKSSNENDVQSPSHNEKCDENVELLRTIEIGEETITNLVLPSSTPWYYFSIYSWWGGNTEHNCAPSQPTTNHDPAASGSWYDFWFLYQSPSEDAAKSNAPHTDGGDEIINMSENTNEALSWNIFSWFFKLWTRERV